MGADCWINTDWKFDDLDGKTVDFTIQTLAGTDPA